ncbi:fasciclin domain-containing protein [Chitinophaga silvatica]|uniref:Fasciclin domain-containing protein n=1 Tax=Chitinophaga silvatica TaxID=2282649 RepID=A0A3E1YH13_9BACT|nr:fasciclin domain-containing protein [Chitinophaga silvatica]RFS26657.1 fasciclin domain-containing protein [Chitinophaga silvatica]
MLQQSSEAMRLLFTNKQFTMLKLKQFLLCGLVCWLASCSKDNLQPPIDRTSVPRTMGVFIENNYDLSLLNAALKKTGLYDTLINNGPFTLMAPDNNAFNLIGISTIEQIESLNTDSLREVLKYHIIRNRYFTNMLPLQLDNKYITLSGAPMHVSVDVSNYFTASDRMIVINGAIMGKGTKRDIALANGVIHIVTRPLGYNKMTTQEYIAADTSLSFFVAAMKQFKLWDNLKENNPVTIFVPTNNAFLKNNITLEKIKAMNPADYSPVTFGIYALMMKPMRIFTTDGYMIGQLNINGGSIARVDSTYGVSPNYSTWSGNKAEIWIYKWKGGSWVVNTEGPASIQYNQGFSNCDHLCNNGVVHIVDDIFLQPDLMKR